MQSFSRFMLVKSLSLRTSTTLTLLPMRNFVYHRYTERSIFYLKGLNWCSKKQMCCPDKTIFSVKIFTDKKNSFVKITLLFTMTIQHQDVTIIRLDITRESNRLPMLSPLTSMWRDR